MDVAEVATLLKKSPYTVRKMARLGALPGARKVGRDWRFNGDRIRRFAGEPKEAH